MNKDVKERRKAPLQTPTDLGDNARRDIAGALNALLADVFALYLKTKNFHWHVSGPHFRDYHLMLDEQADAIFATTDPLAELRSDNQALIASMREAHELCEAEKDVATTSLIEVWIDQTERRVWFLYEASRRGDQTGH